MEHKAEKTYVPSGYSCAWQGLKICRLPSTAKVTLYHYKRMTCFPTNKNREKRTILFQTIIAIVTTINNSVHNCESSFKHIIYCPAVHFGVYICNFGEGYLDNSLRSCIGGGFMGSDSVCPYTAVSPKQAVFMITVAFP